MRRLAVLLTACGAAIAAPPAGASELGWVGSELEYRAAPGETNAVSVSTQGSTIVVSDSAASITLSVPFCTQTDAHTVSCEIAPPPGLPGPMWSGLTALLGDGDDSAVATGNPMLVTLHGDDGNDRLTVGGPATLLNGLDEAFGDAGDDQVSGGAGPEFLRGGAGADVLTGGEDDDILDGGDGADVLMGGPGSDQLQGWSGDDRLDGGPDTDRSAGKNGDDVIAVGDDDVANGGKGDDSLVATGPRAATIGCSGGQDRVAPSRADRVALSCERIEQTVSCGAGRACRVAVVLATAARRVLATTTKRVGAGRTRTLGLTLARRVRQEVRRRKRIALTLRTKALAGKVAAKRVPLAIQAAEPFA
jgi:hypothetical protein